MPRGNFCLNVSASAAGKGASNDVLAFGSMVDWKLSHALPFMETLRGVTVVDLNIPNPPTLAIVSDQHKALLNLKVEDGKLVAEYDPDDLDEAAKVFVDYLKKTFNQEQ